MGSPSQSLLKKTKAILPPGAIDYWTLTPGVNPQTVYGTRGVYNGRLGSTGGSDANDPVLGRVGATFDGTDYIDLLSTAPSVINTASSFAVLVCATTGSSATMELFSRDNGFRVTLNAGTLRIQAFDGAQQVVATAPVTYGDGVPRIYTGAWAASSKKIEAYINGTLGGSTTNPALTEALSAGKTMMIGSLGSVSLFLPAGTVVHAAALYAGQLTAGDHRQLIQYMRSDCARRGVVIP